MVQSHRKHPARSTESKEWDISEVYSELLQSFHTPDEKQLSGELAREGVVRHGRARVEVGSSVTVEVKGDHWSVSHRTGRQRAQDGKRLEP